MGPMRRMGRMGPIRPIGPISPMAPAARPGFAQAIGACLRGRVLVVGLGNPLFGDDGCGVLVAEAIRESGAGDAICAGTSPERHLGMCAGYDTVVFVDAVEMGAAPGSVALMDAAQVASRYPQVSTHKISLGALARFIQGPEGAPQVWLIGIQPGTVRAGAAMSDAVVASARGVAAALTAWDGWGPRG
ncbi:MAG: hydrogenase maturation protease, partial [Armatimonadetes bacterium]|nr:hydrogenase maturation protease [Armatimonadota bacterium]